MSVTLSQNGQLGLRVVREGNHHPLALLLEDASPPNAFGGGLQLCVHVAFVVQLVSSVLVAKDLDFDGFPRVVEILLCSA